MNDFKSSGKCLLSFRAQERKTDFHKEDNVDQALGLHSNTSTSFAFIYEKIITPIRSDE